MAKVNICDGRTQLYRWDTGVKIEMCGCTNVTECHFVTADGVIRRDVEDNICDVPDVALTKAGMLVVYAFARTADEGVTRHEFRLAVQDRPKPADYIDPPDEYDNLDELAKRVAPLVPPAPYTLPTASAETLGGVKVGAGLQMEDGVLGVKPESGMVLIEKITVGEEVVEIIRDREPDETPYNFAAVTIRAKFPPSNKTGNLAIFFTFKWPAEIRNYMINPYNETWERTGYSKCYLSNNRWRGGWWSCAPGAGDFAQYYENPVQQEQFGVEDGYITRIKVHHVNGIEAGTTIEILGVRANA